MRGSTLSRGRWPVAVVLLAYFRRRHVLLLVLLAGVSVWFDFRSFAGLCALAAALVMWRGRPNDAKVRTLRPQVTVVILIVVLYQAGAWPAVNGHLGESIQARTVSQTESGRSLIVAARPEWSAAVALAKARPIGFGPGVIPDAFDVGTAKDGLVSVGATTDGTYVDQYLLGSHIELHSVASDMWANFGLLGLLVAATIAWLIVKRLARRLSRGGLDALTAFAVMLGLWDMAFSPLGDSLPHVVFAISPGGAFALTGAWLPPPDEAATARRDGHGAGSVPGC
jgi:hypothetical protein